jgi:hypothetical protein
MKITGGLCSAVVFAAVLTVIGCAKEVIEYPGPEKLEAALDGMNLMIELEALVIEARDIEDFKVLENHVGPEGKSATSVIKFTFLTRGSNYELEGMLTYVLKPGGELEDPFFEPSVVTKQ